MVEHTYIEIYLKNNEKPTYEIKDNDAEILISPFLLWECIENFYLGDENTLVKLSIEELKQRAERMRQKFHILPEHISYKINLSKNIKKSIEV